MDSHGHCKTWGGNLPFSPEVLSLRQGGKTQMEPFRWWSDRGIWNEGDEGEEIWFQNLSVEYRNIYWILIIKFDKIRKEIVQNLISFYMASVSVETKFFYFKYLLLLGSNGLCKPFGLRWFLKVFPIHPTSSFLTVPDSQEVLTVVKNMDTKAVERCRQLHDDRAVSKTPGRVVATQTLLIFHPDPWSNGPIWTNIFLRWVGSTTNYW